MGRDSCDAEYIIQLNVLVVCSFYMTILEKEDYFDELRDIKSKLSDFLDQIRGGNLSYFKDLSLKLRILYCNKSGTKALLTTIQQLYGFNIFVLVKWSMTEKVKRGLLPQSILEGLAVEQINSVAGWFDRGHEMVPIMDAVNKSDEILIQNKYYSYRDIFEAIADKMGGAHIDSSVPDNMLIPHSKNLLVLGLSIAQRAAFDTARTSIMLIDLISEYIETGEENIFIKNIK